MGKKNRQTSSPLITPGRIVGVIVTIVLGLWLRGSFCAGSGKPSDGDRSNWTSSSCTSDRDCPAGQRCFLHETGQPEAPRTQGYCTRK